MRNYYEYWAKRFIKDGLKAMKIVIGLGCCFGLFGKPSHSYFVF